MPPQPGREDSLGFRNTPTSASVQRLRAAYDHATHANSDLIDAEYDELTAILLSLVEAEAAPASNAKQPNFVIVDSDNEEDSMAKIRADIQELGQFTKHHGSIARDRFRLWITELERIPKLSEKFLSKEVIESAKTRQNATDDDVQIISVLSHKRPAPANTGHSGRQETASASTSKRQKAKDTHKNAFVPLLPSFYLNRGHGLASNESTSVTTLSLKDIVLPGCERAVLTNYNFHMGWLLTTCESLKTVPRILCVTGDGPDTTYENEGVLDRLNLRSQIAIVRAALPFQFGTHHSKIMILFYPKVLRLVICTANFVPLDWGTKTQGIYMRDFPRIPKTGKNEDSLEFFSDFGSRLVMYLKAVEKGLTPRVFGQSASGTSLQNQNTRQYLSQFISDLQWVDFRSAGVCLVPSVPGKHAGITSLDYGVLRVQSILEKESALLDSLSDPHFIAQFSSFSSTSAAWVDQFRACMLGKFDSTRMLSKPKPPKSKNTRMSFASSLIPSSSSSSSPLPPPLNEVPLSIIWPTFHNVSHAVEEDLVLSGGSLPSKQENVTKTHIASLLHSWVGSQSGRDRYMPHIKTYVLYDAKGKDDSTKRFELKYLLLTSCNFSKQAWGQSIRYNPRNPNQSEIFITSYEMGVLYLPSIFCLPAISLEQELFHSSMVRQISSTSLWPNCHMIMPNESRGNDAFAVPLPYDLPLVPYSKRDAPWHWGYIDQ